MSDDSAEGRTQCRNLAMVLFLGMVVLGIGARNLGAQVSVANSSLHGLINDRSGGAVPGALVTLSSTTQAFARTFASLEDGRYSFPALPPGTYTLKVDKSGFTTYQQTGIILEVGQSTTQDVSLQVGAVTQSVTVTGAGAILQTSNANLSTDLSAQQVTELPLNLRNILSLMFTNSMANNSVQWQVLSGGSARGIQDGDLGFMNFGGGRFGTTAYLLDGQWDSSNDWIAPIWVPGIDETQEMRIQTNSFTAQYGWSTGNVVNVVTKGGTSQLHGDVWEFLRNSAMDANTFFNNAGGVAKPPFRRNQFGGTLGGPIYIPHIYEKHDKTFFFVSYEGNRESTPATAVDTMPTSAFRTGDFSALLGSQAGTDCLGRPVLSGQLYNPFTTRSITAGQVDAATGLTATCGGKIRDPFVGNIIPSGMIDPVAKNLLPYWPNPSNSALFSNYTATGPLAVSYDRGNGRIDHNISDRQRMFFRMSIEHEFKTEFPPLYGASDVGGPGSIRPENRFDYGADYVITINPSTVLTVTGGWGRWTEDLTPQGEGFKNSTVGLPSFLDGIADNFPGISISGTSGLGSGTRAFNPREVRTIAADLTKIHGPHTMTTGFMFVGHQTPNVYANQPTFNFGSNFTQGPDPTAANPATGWGFASFLLGTGNSGGVTINQSPVNSNEWYALYFQDDWRATRKLTLNLGIRWDYQTGVSERHDRNAWFDFTGINPVSTAIGYDVPGFLVYEGGGNGNRRRLYQVQNNNFAPRLGLAYQLTNKLVMRAGFGLFYSLNAEIGGYQGLDIYGFSQTTPYVGTVDGITPANLLSDPFPSGLIQPAGKAQGALTNLGLSTDAWSGFRPTPYVEQWTTDFQYAITPNNLIDASYIGNHGVKLPFGGLDMNQLQIKDLSMGDALLNPVANPFYNYFHANNLVSGCGLDQPTVPQGQLLLPYPEYCSLNSIQNNGSFSNFNALQLTFTRRWSQGLQFVASFTASKYLSNAEGWEDWTVPGSGTIRNYYNLAAEKSLDGADIPKSLVLNYIYQLPVGHGKHFGNDMSGPLNAVVGGWQVSGISTFKDGFPLSITADNNNTGSFGGSQRPNLVGDPHISNPTIQEWFNTAAFAQPAAFTFGNVGRTMPNLRAPGINTTDLGIQKYWNASERWKVEFRAEAYNIANHPLFFAPDTGFGDPAFGTITSAFPGRSIQFSLKAFW
jgi:hypothetical protein